MSSIFTKLFILARFLYRLIATDFFFIINSSFRLASTVLQSESWYLAVVSWMTVKGAKRGATPGMVGYGDS